MSTDSLGKISRREFLRNGSAAIAAAAIPVWRGGLCGIRSPFADHCILLFLAGGPSHIDTWDMKPEAISGVRGPFRPIATSVSGIQICEIFPRMAKQAHNFALVRSLHSRTEALHDAASVEIQTGRHVSASIKFPHCGSVISKFRSDNRGVPGHVVISSAKTGEAAVFCADDGPSFNAVDVSTLSEAVPRELRSVMDISREPVWIRESYGNHGFGRACLRARRLVEHGISFVTVNLCEFESGMPSWDIHGSFPFSNISCYRNRLGPMFDSSYSALLQDLASRGLLRRTLVIAVGEFGRTPRINSWGGRDHWTGCWTAVLAGGGVRGGQVIGSSDAVGYEPRDRPFVVAQVAATIYHALGVPFNAQVFDAGRGLIPIVDSGIQPIVELF